MKISLTLLLSLLLTACHNSSSDPEPVVTASFTLPTSAEATGALLFQNTSQNASSYRWSFGDGTSDRTATPTHSYAKAGTYQVTLRAYGTHKDSASTTQSLVVAAYDILMHTTTKVVGTYDYKLYRAINYYSPTIGTSTYTYQGSGVATVDRTGPAAMLITTPNFATKAAYAPAAGTVVAANGPNLQFQTDLSEYGLAHFYTSGDSLLLTKYSHFGHYYFTIDYYRGHRRQ